MRQAQVRAYRSGLFAETVTALLLRLKGHRIVARRYKTPVGEIDLVALKGRRLAFIEVRRRKTAEDAPGRFPPSSGGASSGPRNSGLPGTLTSQATTSPSTWCWRRLGPGRAISPAHFPFDAYRISSLPGLTRQSMPLALRRVET
jgi:Uncharacterised protein family UPF0102